jgi:hypothetical protein
MKIAHAVAALALGGLACSSGLSAPMVGDAGRPETSVGGPEAGRDASHESSGSDAAEDRSNNAPYPASHPATPKATWFGGPVLTAPQLVPIFFADDPLESEIESFLTAFAASSFWPTVTKEYGVGPLSIAPSIVVTDAPPVTITDAEVDAWIGGYLNGTHASWPPAALDNIYMVFYPMGTTITVPQDGSSCVGFGGYHYEGRIPTTDADGAADAGNDATVADAGPSRGGMPFTYAVIPRCSTFAGYTGIDTVTLAVSHETVEASTDPLNRTDVAYGGVDEDHLVWQLAPGGEVADLCAYEPQSYQRLVGDFLVQRIWSNTEAEASHDPCVPPIPVTPSPVYFNAAPGLTAHVSVTEHGSMYPSEGIKVPVGQSATFDLYFFSDEPLAAWIVYMDDSSFAFGGERLLQFSPNYVMGRNGDVVSVKVTAVAAGAYGGSEMFLTSYAMGNESTLNYWFGFAQN